MSEEMNDEYENCKGYEDYDPCAQCCPCAPCNQYMPCGPCDLCDSENCIENEFIRDNQRFLNNQENKDLKNKIEELNQIIIQKNKELEENRIKNDNQLIKINKTFDTHINEYQKLMENFSRVQEELNNAKNEIKNKELIINQLQGNMNLNNDNLQAPNMILLLNQKLKDIYQDFFNDGNNQNIFNENDYLNLDNNDQLQLLMNYIDNFYQQLNNFKQYNFNEIMKLRNLLQRNNNNQNNNNINPQFYLNFINLINNFLNNIPNNIGNFPNYSLKDNNNKKYKDILTTIKILTDYIISTQNNNNNQYNLNDIDMNYKYNELNKKLKEMSDLLIESNECLKKAKQENNILKQKYNELENKYNLSIKDVSSIENNNNNKDKDYENLINKLNKKNQQIRSLEHMIARLTNKNNNNMSNIINPSNKSMFTDTSYYGKIVNKKIFNEIKNNNQNSLYFNNNFIKDAKSEKSLRKFLNKYTDGEYDNALNKSKDFNNIINIEDEIENLNRGTNNEIEFDDFGNENNYNEEEEEKKYQMEGKIYN